MKSPPASPRDSAAPVREPRWSSELDGERDAPGNGLSPELGAYRAAPERLLRALRMARARRQTLALAGGREIAMRDT